MRTRAAIAFEAGRPFRPVPGQLWKGTACDGAKGLTMAPEQSASNMNGKIKTDPMITRVHTRNETQKRL